MDAQVRQLVGNLEDSVQAMQDLLDGLLDLSRLESGAVTVNRAAASVGGLFDSVRSALEPLAAAKGLRLRVRNSNAWVLTDGLVLQRMVMNLAHNAIRYTQSGSVLLTCRPANHGQSVRIEIWDSGIGISPEHQSDIFREFYQVGNAGRDRGRGLGLGLSIVERSARLLGHEINLRSNLGCGTRFSIGIPTASAPVERPGSGSSSGDESGVDPLELQGLRVLVVEDDAMARDAIEALLAAWGCRVCAALSLDQARHAVQQGFVPDVIVSDYRLGDTGNGLMAIAALRSVVGRDVAACLMSGDTDGGLMQAARDAGLILLHKPVRPAKLRAFLRRAVMAPPKQ
jgi:CheY-like chemotaxis protein